MRVILAAALLVASAVIGYRWLESGSGALVYYFLFLPLVWLAVRGGLRLLVIGAAAGAVTYGIGRLLGAAVS